MNNYKKITFLENKKNIKTLLIFKDLVIKYFEDSRVRVRRFSQIDSQTNLVNIRTDINKNIEKIVEIIYCANISTTMDYTAPPILGSYTTQVELIRNIFNLHQFQSDHQIVMDYIDRAIGVYENDRINSIIRTFNPIFWLIRLLDIIVDIPFRLIGKIGFNEEKVRHSILGKIISGVLYLLFTIIPAIITYITFIK